MLSEYHQPDVKLGWLDKFYGISSVVGYLMPDPVYMYISNMDYLRTNNLVVKFQINQSPFVCRHLNGFKYCYQTLTVLFTHTVKWYIDI